MLGLGKFNKFYWTIILSALFKLLINASFKLDFQELKNIKNISFLNEPILNKHIFVRFLYYYLGFICLGTIFYKMKTSKNKNKINYEKKNESAPEDNFSSDSGTRNASRSLLIHTSNYLELISDKSFRNIFPTIIIYIIYEILIFYIDQGNYGGINFWIFQIFFMHFLLLKSKKLKLFKHQILSFSIIIILSFGIKFISSFTKQCEYPLRDPNDIDEEFKKIINGLDPISRNNTIIIKKINETLRKAIINTNEEGTKACKNMYNILLLDDYFEYFIILSALGYLLGLFLHSYSAIKFKSFIDEKYISPYLIISFIGIIGFFGSLIFLIISTFIPCGKNNIYIKNFCHSIESAKYEKSENELNTTDYFDNFFSYIYRLNDAFHPHTTDKYIYGEDVKDPKDGVLEIIFSFLLSVFGFFKTTFDLYIIKELTVFHLLFPEVIYQLIKDIIIVIYKISNSIIDQIQITQFIFIALSHFFALIGFAIYLELVIVKCCGFDENVKDKIILRSLIDTRETEIGRDSDIGANEEEED